MIQSYFEQLFFIIRLSTVSWQIQFKVVLFFEEEAFRKRNPLLFKLSRWVGWGVHKCKLIMMAECMSAIYAALVVVLFSFLVFLPVTMTVPSSLKNDLPIRLSLYWHLYWPAGWSFSNDNWEIQLYISILLKSKENPKQ